MLTNPDKFASLFNSKVPGAYRSISPQDVLDMKSCGLIGRSNYYGRDDLETVRAVLEYEQLRENRPVPPTLEDKQEPPKCKRCEKKLPAEPAGKVGRPKEYCVGCEPFRNRDRQRRLGSRRRQRRNKFPSTKTAVL